MPVPALLPQILHDRMLQPGQAGPTASLAPANLRHGHRLAAVALSTNIQLSDLRHGHRVDQVSGVQVAQVNDLRHGHRLAAGALSTNIQLSDLRHGHRVAEAHSRVKSIKSRHGHRIQQVRGFTPGFLSIDSTRFGHRIEQVSGIATINVTGVRHGHRTDQLGDFTQVAQIIDVRHNHRIPTAAFVFTQVAQIHDVRHGHRIDVAVVIPAFGDATWTLSSRKLSDGHSVEADDWIYLRPGETLRVIMDFDKLLPDGVKIISATVLGTGRFSDWSSFNEQQVSWLMRIPGDEPDSPYIGDAVVVDIVTDQIAPGTRHSGVGRYAIRTVDSKNAPKTLPFVSQPSDQFSLAERDALIIEDSWTVNPRTLEFNHSVASEDFIVLRPGESKWVKMDLSPWIHERVSIMSASAKAPIAIASDLRAGQREVKMLLSPSSSEPSSRIAVEVTVKTDEGSTLKPLGNVLIRAKDFGKMPVVPPEPYFITRQLTHGHRIEEVLLS